MFRHTVLWVLLTFMTTSALAGGDPDKGKVLIKSWNCTQCHGLTGNDRSAQEFAVPMLAGQPAAFIVMRLKQYKSTSMEGDKSWERMTTFAQGLSETDMQDIATYYEAQKRY